SANIDCGKIFFKEHLLEVIVVPANSKLFRYESCLGTILVTTGHYLDVGEFYEDGKMDHLGYPANADEANLYLPHKDVLPWASPIRLRPARARDATDLPSHQPTLEVGGQVLLHENFFVFKGTFEDKSLHN
ncbi:MAG: hypothetical protein V3U68_00745, partial [Bacteroidota bacterium]